MFPCKYIVHMCTPCSLVQTLTTHPHIIIVLLSTHCSIFHTLFTWPNFVLTSTLCSHGETLFTPLHFVHMSTLWSLVHTLTYPDFVHTCTLCSHVNTEQTVAGLILTSGNILSWRLVMKISAAILSLPLIQEGQL